MSLQVTHLMIDIDGVVITGRPKDGASWKSGLQADLGIDPDDLRTGFFQPYWQKIVTGQLPLRATLERAKPDIAADALIEYWFRLDSRVNSDLLADIDHARRSGLKVYFATNQEHERAAYLWENLGLKNHADGIIASAQVAAKKPDQAFFKAATKITNAAPENHLLIDDTPENITGAKAANWQATHWDNQTRLPLILPKILRG